MGDGECNTILNIIVRKDVSLFCIYTSSEWSIGVKRADMGGKAFQAERIASGNAWIFSIMFIFASDFLVGAVP